MLGRDQTLNRDRAKIGDDEPRVVLQGLGGRLFLTDWLTLNVALRDYIIVDKFEPPATMNPECNTPDSCKAAADSALVNNFMAYIGVGMYLPTKFTYKTPR